MFVKSLAICMLFLIFSLKTFSADNFQNASFKAVNHLSTVEDLERIIPDNNESIVNQLIAWSEKYEVDLYAVSRQEGNEFFYNNLHLLDEETLKKHHGYYFPQGCKDIERHSVRFYGENPPPERPYLAEEAKKYIKSLASSEGQSLLRNFPLYYLKNVWIGLSWLPENIHLALRHKSFYFSRSIGTSRFIPGTFDYGGTIYFGFTSGVFVQDKENDQSRNLIRNSIVHEIGHLIDDTVLRPYYKLQDFKFRKYYWQFPLFQDLLQKREELFTGTSEAEKEKWEKQWFSDNGISQDVKHDQRMQSIRDYGISKITGFLTGKSEQSGAEDFADHFCAFIFERCIHKSLHEKRLNPNYVLAHSPGITPAQFLSEYNDQIAYFNKDGKGSLLEEKYKFFNVMLGINDSGAQCNK